MKPFTEETINTIIKIGGNGTLSHLKSNRTITILLYKKRTYYGFKKSNISRTWS